MRGCSVRGTGRVCEATDLGTGRRLRRNCSWLCLRKGAPCCPTGSSACLAYTAWGQAPYLRLILGKVLSPSYNLILFCG